MQEEPLFLSAQWQYLAMSNYEVPPEIVLPYVPKGTEPDFYNGKTYASLVGFWFAHTRVMGFSIPFHRNFEEVNLRLYVRRQDADGQWQRGVVFVKEIVPRMAIALTARWVYNEPYISLPMQHSILLKDSNLLVEYRWKFNKEWNFIKVRAEAAPHPLQAGTLEEFITEHYWGFNRQKNGNTMAYRVAHPQWQIFGVHAHEVHCNVAQLYGKQFEPYLQTTPASVLLAQGSAIEVRKGRIVSG
ncbi:DUF2071 domain-containing protein [Sphingobacteriales bacterium UPWRP_1]|nr:hypothetical protein BVG80_15370 [Sphingobacteriales bacterium TSM_CSM]PSJ79127.1 DUF2071 domain-containing protein [Sphingobacteriales bacterium UPWRP_1]